MLLPGRSLMQVWRKLLEDVSGQINADLNSELFGRARRRSIVRDVGIGDCDRSGIPKISEKLNWVWGCRHEL